MYSITTNNARKRPFLPRGVAALAIVESESCRTRGRTWSTQDFCLRKKLHTREQISNYSRKT